MAGAPKRDDASRKLPVRRGSEPFRSRRISSPSFAQGCYVELQLPHAGGPRSVRGRVLDVSIQGVGALLPGLGETAARAFSVGTAIEQLVLVYYGDELYRGRGRVEHCQVTDEGLRLGLYLDSDVLDLHTLHRQVFRLGFRHRWRQVLADFEQAEPAPAAVAPTTEPAVQPEFAAWVQQSRRYLEAVRAFLDDAEEQNRDEDLVTRGQNLEDMFTEACPAVLQQIDSFSEELNHRIEEIPNESLAAHRRLMQEQFAESILQGPFYQRAFSKPLGYAGDYELMNMLYRPEPDGQPLFARILDVSAKDQPAGRATIGRIEYLGRIITESIEASNLDRVRIATIGCGAAREILELLSGRPEVGQRLDLALLDQDTRALEHCERTLTPLARTTSARLQFIGEPIQKLIAEDYAAGCLGERELIYSAGLFDYLDDEVFRQLVGALYHALAPEGLLVVGNMASHNPTRHFMEAVMDWYLIHRSPDDLRRLAISAGVEDPKVTVDAEPTGINLFLQARR